MSVRKIKSVISQTVTVFRHLYWGAGCYGYCGFVEG